MTVWWTRSAKSSSSTKRHWRMLCVSLRISHRQDALNESLSLPNVGGFVRESSHRVEEPAVLPQRIHPVGESETQPQWCLCRLRHYPAVILRTRSRSQHERLPTKDLCNLIRPTPRTTTWKGTASACRGAQLSKNREGFAASSQSRKKYFAMLGKRRPFRRGIEIQRKGKGKNRK